LAGGVGASADCVDGAMVDDWKSRQEQQAPGALI
jgi:hypothetical protein